MSLISEKIVTLSRRAAQDGMSFGLPFPKGQLFDIACLQLKQADIAIPLSAEVTGSWPDGSIRWVLCKVCAYQSGPVDVHFLPDNEESDKGKGSAHALSALVSSGWIGESKPQFSDGKNSLFTLFKGVVDVSVSLKLKGQKNSLSLNSRCVFSQVDTLSESYIVKGVFVSDARSFELECKVVVYRDTGASEVMLRLHNPQAAEHKGDCWDLGDAGSIVIDGFSLSIGAPSASASIGIVDEGDANFSTVQIQAPFVLDQRGSGGEHWGSPIHWDENKNSTVQENGFLLSTEDGETVEGLRACPVVWLYQNSKIYHILPEEFWQNFPSKISVKDGVVSWVLLVSGSELQGGESKTWRLKMSECGEGSNDSCDLFQTYSQNLVCYNPSYLNECEVFPHLSFSPERLGLSALIQNGLRGDSSFFNKREETDVYGWRHYGELYADHERHGLAEVPYFISHYNNQYDPLMGMTIQFLHHWDSDWLALVHPLNRHIQDIDIYDTQLDKAEYNGGLFWHTNHYLPAETCSHRSYSRYHTAVYDDYQGGGGPGGQHCYTTGLAMQYRLFGDEQAKRKVDQLCNWVRCFYNGSGSILDRTFRLLTIDFKQNQFTNIGVKAPGYRYPLDRGTGNYLIALLDNYDVSDKSELLVEAASVIRQTCHPSEDIALRSLDDIENTWFYTVFLQAVARYAFLKESLDETDNDYWYARDSLVHYGHWMLSHEGFYLDRPDVLEFPNDTWCAQEIRKANLLCCTYYFSEQENNKYLKRADEYYRYIENRLSASSEAQYTRILSLLMQNDGVQQKFRDPIRSPVVYKTVNHGAVPAYSIPHILKAYLKDILKSIGSFSLKREVDWVSVRLRSRVG